MATRQDDGISLKKWTAQRIWAFSGASRGMYDLLLSKEQVLDEGVAGSSKGSGIRAAI